MDLHTLFKKNADQAVVYLTELAFTSNEATKNELRRYACEHQLNASFIAHLIAVCGNLYLADFDVERLRSEIAAMPFIGINPYMEGLKLVQFEIDSLF